MAENREIVVKLSIDSSGTQAGLNDVQEELKGVEKEVNNINNTPLTLDEQLKEITKSVEGGGLSMRELTKKIKDYQTIAVQAGRESPVGREAIMRAASLQDELGDLRNEITRLSADGQKMQGALALGSAVAGGYGALQGVMALAGQENEALMQSLVKMQAAQSVLAGIEQLRLSLEKESVLMLSLKNTQTKIATGLTAAYATVVGTTTGGLKLLRLALISTGIGAIIVGLGLLIANFDKVTMAVKWAYNQVIELWYGFQELGAGVKILLSIMFPFVGVIWAVTEALQAMGVVETVEQRKTREAIEAKMKITTAAHNKRVDELHKQMDAVKAAAAAEIESTKSVIEGIDREIELRRAAGEETKELEEKKLAVLVSSAQAQYNISKALIRLQNEELFARRQTQIELAKDAGKNTKEMEKALEFEKRQLDLKVENDLKVQKDALDQALHNLKVFQISAETERKNAQKKELEDEVKHQSEIEKVRSRKAENIKIADKEVETSSANLYMMLGQMQDEANKKQEKADKEALDRKLANIQKAGDVAEGGFEFLENLNAIFSKDSEKNAKRDFQINKARDLAGAVTNTAKGVTQALASAPPPLSFVNAAAVGALGASNIARIASTKFGSASSGGSSPSISIPTVGGGGANGGNNTNSVQNDNLTNIAELLSNQQPPVLVVDSFNKVNREAEKIKAVASI